VVWYSSLHERRSRERKVEVENIPSSTGKSGPFIDLWLPFPGMCSSCWQIESEYTTNLPSIPDPRWRFTMSSGTYEAFLFQWPKRQRQPSPFRLWCSLSNWPGSCKSQNTQIILYKCNDCIRVKIRSNNCKHIIINIITSNLIFIKKIIRKLEASIRIK
jgi:hypothetical protein